MVVTASSGTCDAVRAGHVDAAEVVRVALELRIDLENDAILVALAVERRNLPLPECVVERSVDVLDLDAQPSRGDPIWADIDLQTGAVPIASIR